MSIIHAVRSHFAPEHCPKSHIGRREDAIGSMFGARTPPGLFVMVVARVGRGGGAHGCCHPSARPTRRGGRCDPQGAAPSAGEQWLLRRPVIGAGLRVPVTAIPPTRRLDDRAGRHTGGSRDDRRAQHVPEGCERATGGEAHRAAAGVAEQSRRRAQVVGPGVAWRVAHRAVTVAPQPPDGAAGRRGGRSASGRGRCP